MPYLHLKTNASLTSDQSAPLLSQLSKLMAQETGKPERYVLVELTESKAMLFAGTTDSLAYLECKSIGLTAKQSKSLSAAISKLLGDSLQIDSGRI